jgi:hypothetical protein
MASQRHGALTSSADLPPWFVFVDPQARPKGAGKGCALADHFGGQGKLQIMGDRVGDLGG